ncbi:TPA: hypothetical protein I9Y49_000867 [Citrobacter koseri]|nr:hypothetical protein [Citrobacter koseri]
MRRLILIIPFLMITSLSQAADFDVKQIELKVKDEVTNSYSSECDQASVDTKRDCNMFDTVGKYITVDEVKRVHGDNVCGFASGNTGLGWIGVAFIQRGNNGDIELINMSKPDYKDRIIKNEKWIDICK